MKLVLVTLLALGASVPASAATLPGFRSPSGNISCLFIPSNSGAPATILCKLAHADYANALQSRCKGLDWHGFTVGPTGPGLVNCSGGIQYNPANEHPRYVTLGYGRTWRAGPFTCASMRTGLTCRNRGAER